MIFRIEENNSKTFMVQLVSTWNCAHMVYTCRERAATSYEVLLLNHKANFPEPVKVTSVLCFVTFKANGNQSTINLILLFNLNVTTFASVSELSEGGSTPLCVYMRDEVRTFPLTLRFY